MSKISLSNSSDPDLPDEIDFSGGVQGKYAPRAEGSEREALLAQLARLIKERDDAEAHAGYLQAEVDRLHTENQRLRQELAAAQADLSERSARLRPA